MVVIQQMLTNRISRFKVEIAPRTQWFWTGQFSIRKLDIGNFCASRSKFWCLWKIFLVLLKSQPRRDKKKSLRQRKVRRLTRPILVRLDSPRYIAHPVHGNSLVPYAVVCFQSRNEEKGKTSVFVVVRHALVGRFRNL